jgi:putative SOS response-associated peptidase YedK
MPVILDRESEEIWLNSKINEDRYLSLLKPYDAKETEYYSVSSLVNSPDNDSKELILPTPPTDQFGNYSLFD